MSARRALVVILAAGFLLRAALYILFPNQFWPDETFQTLEPAHRLAFGEGIVSWEFRDGTRSWLLPGVLAGVMWATDWLGSGSGGYLLGCALVLALLSLLPAIGAFAWARKHYGDRLALLAAFATLVWSELLYFSSKALTEVVAAHFLVLAVYLAIEGRTSRRLLAAGALLGLVVGLRVHLAPAALAVILLASRHDLRSRLPLLAASSAAVFAAVGLLDLLTWSYPFQSFWLSFRVNVVGGKAAQWGVQPFHHYVTSIGAVWSLAAVVVLGLGVLVSRKLASVLVVAAVILLTHSLIGHKEYRFIYPAQVLLVVAASVGACRAVQLAAKNRPRWLCAAGVGLAWVLASGYATSRLTSERTGSNLMGGPDRSHWTRHAGGLEAMRYLSTRSDVCGIGLVAIHWSITGGYSHLHRDVPIYTMYAPDEMAAGRPSYNFSVGPVAPGEAYQREACFAGVCVFSRPGECEDTFLRGANERLVEVGQ